MGATQIAANLAFINWVVLTGLAVGSMGAVVLLRERTAATRGYLSFTAFTAAAFGLLALLSDLNLPSGIEGLPVTPDPAFDAPRRVALGVFTALAVVYMVAMARSRRATPVGLLGIAAGIAVNLVAALGWGGQGLGSLLLLTQLLALDLAIGGVWAAMILGHWYLVTPKLPEQPRSAAPVQAAPGVTQQLDLFSDAAPGAFRRSTRRRASSSSVRARLRGSRKTWRNVTVGSIANAPAFAFR